jgi:hypothetical protein
MEGEMSRQREDGPPVAVGGCEVLRETGKALHVSIEGEAPIWIPKSQLDRDSEVREQGDVGTIIITAWIAKQKKLS